MKILPIVEIRSLEGERITGATMSSAQAIEDKLRRTSKPYCVVLAWVVIDVKGAESLVPVGSYQLPMIMYSHEVISHSTEQLAQGEAVLTGFATHYDPCGIFETVDTVYILLNRGFRKTVHIDTVRAAR